MKSLTTENKFFLIFLSTVVITRVSLFIAGMYASNADMLGFTLFGFRLHHYMYGLILIPIGILATNIFFYAIGMGLFVDELTYLLIGGQTHADNYSWISLVGTAVIIAGIFFTRKLLMKALRSPQFL